MARDRRSRHIGETSRSAATGGFALEIVGSSSRKGYDVLVHDGHGTVRRGVPYQAFLDGRVSSPYAPTACGTGCMGSGPYTSTGAKRAHGAWANILAACRDGARGMADEWLDFQAFAAWYEAHYYDTSLDLVMNVSLSGGDHYGPDTCVLIPRELSNSTPKQQAKPRPARRVARGHGKVSLPQGVHGTSYGRYAAAVSSGGRTLELGPFGTPEEARSAYLSAKADVLEAHAARLDPVMSDEGRAAVARCCARLRDEAGSTPAGTA